MVDIVDDLLDSLDAERSTKRVGLRHDHGLRDYDCFNCQLRTAGSRTYRMKPGSNRSEVLTDMLYNGGECVHVGQQAGNIAREADRLDPQGDHEVVVYVDQWEHNHDRGFGHFMDQLFRRGDCPVRGYIRRGARQTRLNP